MITLKWFHIILIGWIAIIFNSELPGNIEGKLFPVIDSFQITQTENAPYSTLFYGFFHKNRNCVRLEIEWFVEQGDDGVIKIPVTFPEGGKGIMVGYQTFGPWKMNATMDQIEANSYAFIRHKCHSLWTTITKVYP